MVLAVVDDLLFSSRIRAAAQAVGASVTVLRLRDAILPAMREHRAALVIIDLDRDALDPIGLIREIRARPEFAGTRLIGFVSHVHVDRQVEARQAGCDRVMARSGFVEALPDLLASTVGWQPT